MVFPDLEHEICKMMSMKKFAHYLPILLLLVIMIGCREVKDPEFRRIENFKLKGIGPGSSVVGFNITYFNPNGFGVAVKEAEAEVFIDSVSIGTFRQDNQVDVGKSAEFSIPLTGSISYDKARKLNIETLPLREVQVRANGNVKVGKAGVFITRPFQYEGKHRLTIKL